MYYSNNADAIPFVYYATFKYNTGKYWYIEQVFDTMSFGLQAIVQFLSDQYNVLTNINIRLCSYLDARWKLL